MTIPSRPPSASWHDLLALVLRRATDNVAAGGGPFAALVVRADQVLATGVNRVTVDLDPTAHAEVVAIRAACAALGDFRLTGCVLVTSCEPCPLCLSAALWARVDRVVFAADRRDAAAAGFDDERFYTLLSQLAAPDAADPFVQQMPIAGRRAPFETWLRNRERVAY